MKVDLDRVIRWTTYLRNHPENRERFLECFWPSQLSSKQWLIDNLERETTYPTNIFIFGGWFGVFAQLMHERFPMSNIYSVDIDPLCEQVGKEICANISNITFITANMAEFEYPCTPDVIINCSTEHIDQATYDAWWKKVPNSVLFFLQGNDFFACKEHVRCAESLDDFCTYNRLWLDVAHMTTMQLECDGDFTRFMAFGVK